MQGDTGVLQTTRNGFKAFQGAGINIIHSRALK
jgi:hypothetical protein